MILNLALGTHIPSKQKSDVVQNLAAIHKQVEVAAKETKQRYKFDYGKKRRN